MSGVEMYKAPKAQYKYKYKYSYTITHLLEDTRTEFTQRYKHHFL